MMSTAFDGIVIIGGAMSGLATACFLRQVGDRRPITVIERDLTYSHAATALSVSGIRTQFSQPANIRLSQRTLQIIRDFPFPIGTETKIAFNENGYLLLASADGLAALTANHAVQMACGADTVLLEKAALAKRFTWLETSDVAAGVFGLSGEGWFDAMGLMTRFRHVLNAMPDIRFIQAHVDGLGHDGTRLTTIHLSDGSALVPDQVVMAAGAGSGRLTAELPVPLPVEPRKRTVFVFECPTPLPAMPLTVDPSGIYVRPEGRRFICGMSPPAALDRTAEADDFEPDWQQFETSIWPILAQRVPAFATLRQTTAWAGHYDYNRFDQNALIGKDPVLENLFHITGFSGHGVQQAPAAGEALAMLMQDNPRHSQKIAQCSELSPHRLVTNRLCLERNII